MSELINNREEGISAHRTARIHLLKEIIKELHHGKSVEEVKSKFNQAVGEISVDEISELEQVLMQEEGIPVTEVQRLCSVHAAVFKGSIQDIHRAHKPEDQPGHPVYTFKRENQEIDRLANFKIALHLDQFLNDPGEANRLKLLEDFSLLYDVDKHYSRKENLLFPFLEKYGIYGPTKVMWAVDDGIRMGIKEVKSKLTHFEGNAELVVDLAKRVLNEVTEMIYKEEHILLPMALEKLTEDEWLQIADQSEEVGYCLIAPDQTWIPERADEPGTGQGLDASPLQEGYIRLSTGIVSVKQMEAILNHLPVDLTFIDEHDIVRYFSQGKERIFVRTKAVIGRSVQNCHPPQSVHVVNQLLADFKAGVKDVEDFWIPVKDKFVYIRYFAIRDQEGTYLGTLEFTQNIKPIQELTGQKRILSTS
ncbi:DUF438 domain-containing protein [Paenibacillus sp. FSL M8-0334]|uniref:DUF438 domain-containing protein n=1 Tax=Paenibacillus campinasensis TaxID=66347 RepID=A0ABW9T6G5_9BACL|nr:DUF438 domain-containing protein [Paenibacillus campinasensis]MUG68898.1 DUF438 domain-containing protein [Paenibacillus campinasensis]